jgi:chemotaxis methyl-accepting protein methylase
MLKQMENDREYKFLLDKIMRNTNIDFSEYRSHLLKRRVQHRLRTAGCDSYWDYVSLLNKEPREYDKLIESLTIKESYFFRDTNVFELLKNEIIPEMIHQKQVEGANEIRVWSCGMGHGQEAYSIAILLCEALGGRMKDFNIRISATDIDKDALEKAPWGSYDKRAFRNMAPHLLFKYFTKAQDRYVVSDRVRVLVDFHRHDIISGCAKQGMDLVLCRNLLIYFEKALQEKAVCNLHGALNSGGFLILGKSETLPERVRGHFEIIDLAERVYRENSTLSVRT